MIPDATIKLTTHLVLVIIQVLKQTSRGWKTSFSVGGELLLTSSAAGVRLLVRMHFLQLCSASKSLSLPAAHGHLHCGWEAVLVPISLLFLHSSLVFWLKKMFCISFWQLGESNQTKCLFPFWQNSLVFVFFKKKNQCPPWALLISWLFYFKFECVWVNLFHVEQWKIWLKHS